MGNSKKILITGGSGLIGTRLTELLQNRGDQVSHLGRTKEEGPVASYTWDIKNQAVDEEAFHSVDSIIHLAGAGLADERWTRQRKIEILNSRVQSSRLLFNFLKRGKHTVKSFISSSAIGYYGVEHDNIIFTEESPPGRDFLAEVTRQWEKEVDQIVKLGVRVAKIRTGVVLSEKGGALKEMATPVRYFVGAPLGSGNQYLSWIHIDDLCAIYIKAVHEEGIQGAYNAVTQTPVTNREMTKAIAKALGRPLIFPAIPEAVLKLILGEMSQMVLTGQKVSGKKIREAGFDFQYDSLEKTMHDLLKTGK